MGGPAAMRRAVFAIVFGGLACQGRDPNVTYSRDVQPILAERCNSCHVAGGIAPFPLTTYGEVAENAALLRHVVANRIMPPWYADSACAEYQDDESLTQAQIDTLVTWVASGLPFGRPGKSPLAPPPRAAGLARVDRMLVMPEAYTPARRPDDYRCFLIDWPEDRTLYVTGFRARPGAPTVVHHVIAFLVAPDRAAEYTALDTEPGPGYTCFGGPGGSFTARSIAGVSLLGAWAPGSTGQDFPAGTGLKVLPGSKIILQVHYNTLDRVPLPDRTTIELKLDSSVAREAAMIFWTNPLWLERVGMNIPAGRSDVMHSFTYDPMVVLARLRELGRPLPIEPDRPFLVHAVGLHMHLLGTRATLAIERLNGRRECLLRLRRWNFGWQRAYLFRQPKRFEPGDSLYLECRWNNSEDAQPIVDGRRLAPRDVAWGEGTTDEMCLGFLYLTGP